MFTYNNQDKKVCEDHVTFYCPPPQTHTHVQLYTFRCTYVHIYNINEEQDKHDRNI